MFLSIWNAMTGFYFVRKLSFYKGKIQGEELLLKTQPVMKCKIVCSLP